jgi:hypothetical protein
MFYYKRRRPNELNYCINCCGYSEFSGIAYGMTLSPSTNHKFYLTIDHNFMWLPHNEKVLERERYTIQSTKLILTIVWTHVSCIWLMFMQRRANWIVIIILPRYYYFYQNDIRLRFRNAHENWYSMVIICDLIREGRWLIFSKRI